MAEKKKYFVFDWGDTPLITNDVDAIIEHIKSDLADLMKGEYPEELQYEIKIKELTDRQYRNIPEWS